jgi:putative glutathione S-transferase
MTTTPTAVPYASPADVATYGEYRITRDDRPRYRFAERIGGTAHPAEPGRYHLYSGWFCPWAHRSTLVVALAGLEHAVSVSYVDGTRDARGWAFRAATGPDPVNGFTLLRDAYDATEPGFDGHVSVPTLWDRHAGRIATNDYATLDVDLASQFLPWSSTGLNLYPDDLRDEIDTLDRWLGPVLDHGVSVAAGSGPAAATAAERVRNALVTIDRSVAGERYLLGDRLTLADVRLFVTLVRYDARANAGGRIGPQLPEYADLWAYARNLYQHRAFRETTDFTSFTRPGAGIPDWDEPAVRHLRAS